MDALVSPTDPRPRRFVGSARTNLPVWPTEPPSPDPAGRGFILLGLGPAARPIVAAWSTIVSATGYPLAATCLGEDAADSSARTWLEEALRPAVVGWRLMLAGPASAILLLAADARAAGMIDGEIRFFATGGEGARLQCVHCKAIFRAEAVPGAQVSCPGCGRTLLVHQHLSRRLAALAAFAADAETQP